MVFDEKVLLWALASRPEDCRRFVTMFQPNWLGDVRFQPILSEIYQFYQKHGEPPSIATLHKVLKERDNDLYELRLKVPLAEIEAEQPDNSEILYTLGKAKGVAICRSFLDLTRDPAFVEREVDYDGDSVLKEVHSWMTKFSMSKGDRTMDLKEAIENLIQTTGFNQINERIPIHIGPIDDWTGKGMRRKQLGVFLAPTGHGKTTVLSIIAHKISTIERKKVWFITNELSIEEVTERMMTRLSGVELERIMDDPILGYKGLNRHWAEGLQNRLWLSEVNREVSADDLEAEMASWANLRGWKPDVIVLDYMERMKPVGTGFRRDKEWQWLGSIAGDLVRLAKRHNLMIWSAAQTNREGLSTTGGITGSMAQSSVRHLQECTSVIGMNQIELPGEDKVAIQFSSIKQRQSKRSPRAVVLECDLAKMNISNNEIDMPALIEAATQAMEGDKDGDCCNRNEKPSEKKGLSPLQKQKKGWK